MEATGKKALHFSLRSLFKHAKQVQTCENLKQTYKEEWAACSTAIYVI